MKTIMIIDGAENCAYDCFSASDELFKVIFPNEGQDIEFYEDVAARSNAESIDPLFKEMWEKPIRKTNINGIDGILFYEQLWKKEYYPNKMDTDLDGIGRGFLSKELIDKNVEDVS